MRSGRCPKCGANNVRVGMKETTGLGQSTNTFIGSALVLGIRTSMTVYVCLYCGYSEEYVTDPAALQTIAEKWLWVQPQSPPPPAPPAPPETGGQK